MQLSEQELRRREEKSELEKLGINPYPPELFEVNVNVKDIQENYEKQKTDYKNVSLAGRLMSRRIMGSASFAEIQDESGKMQIYLRRDDICPGEDKTMYNTVFKFGPETNLDNLRDPGTYQIVGAVTGAPAGHGYGNLTVTEGLPAGIPGIVQSIIGYRDPGGGDIAYTATRVSLNNGPFTAWVF